MTISNNGHIFSCEITGGRCDLPYRCNGPKLGGNYALRVKRGEQCDFEEVVTFDDACDDNQFELSVVLRPPGDGGIAAQP